MTKDKTVHWKTCLCCGVFVWFIINLLQAVFTEIHEDEAYYALYGEYLAWGYFDHPPMVGLMTFLSGHLFSGILGVRLLTILFSCLSLWILWKLVDLKQPDNESVLMFLVTVCAVTMLNVYGFVTTPDAALILFSALFLLVYKRYLESPTWTKAMLMGLLMACMVYSKYHAFLLLGLVVLSNFKLLKDGKFYVACLITVLLLLPHLLWQINAGFPSLSYHLVQRSGSFQWLYFWEYLPNQLLVFNPLVFGAMVYVLVKYRADDRFERGLRFVFVGFFLFFWLMTFRGHVEPHWTIVSVIPLVIELNRKCLIDNKLKKYLKCFVMPSLLLLLLLRVAMMTPLAKSFGFYGKEQYYKAVGEVAGDCPVVFQGSFQQPALYHFFTGGKPSSSLRSYYDRKTQFDIWQFETQWLGQRVFVVSPETSLKQTFHANGMDIQGFFAEQFQTANRLEIDFTLTSAHNGGVIPEICQGDTVRMEFSIHNPYDQTFDFHHAQLDASLVLVFVDTGDYYYCSYDDIGSIPPHETCHGCLSAVIRQVGKTGKNRLALCIGDRIATCVTIESVQEIKVLEHR